MCVCVHEHVVGRVAELQHLCFGAVTSTNFLFILFFYKDVLFFAAHLKIIFELEALDEVTEVGLNLLLVSCAVLSGR